MYKSETSIRVRYADTDQMGYCYYANYAVYFEVGRVEALRQLGVSYKEMEDSGILLPVLDLNIKYIKPAKYDDLLTIETIIPEMPTARIKFGYVCRNQHGELLTEGTTTLVFLRKSDQRPVKAPDELREILCQYFHL
jgi:acyl-CoA thioester hydrolase